MNKTYSNIIKLKLGNVGLLFVTVVFSFFFSCKPNASSIKNSQATINIFPDYKNVTIPVNIAPLNFEIVGNASNYYVEIEGAKQKIIPRIKNKRIIIPEKKWKKLLAQTINDSIKVTVAFNENNSWTNAKAFYWHVSPDSIDAYLSYRLIDPGYVKWFNLGIYQRDLETFKEKAIFTNKHSENNCMNCHTYNNRNPEQFMFHLRANPSGTFISNNGKQMFLDTKTNYTLSAGVYPAWHPSGKLIAMSTNKINQYFHNHQSKSIEVFDRASDIILLDLENKIVTTTPQIATLNRENMPTWSPDGNFLYFIRSPQRTDSSDFKNNHYDLFRIAYDIEQNKWGTIDTIFEASKLGKSLSFPRISPDGKFLLFTMSDYGYFTIHHKEADLYMLNLETNKYFNLKNANSKQTESYHSWSSNSKWIVFSSKRLDKVCGRPYFAHINENGEASKPFVLPVKNPNQHTLRTQSYNIPEFMTSEVILNAATIRETIYKNVEKVQFDTLINIDGLTGASVLENDPSHPYERN